MQNRRVWSKVLTLCCLLALPGCAEEVRSSPPAALQAAAAAVTVDADGDGYAGNDCDDANPAIHPNLPELPNGIDDNCDGRIDEPRLLYATARPREDQSYAQLAALTFVVTDAATRKYIDDRHAVIRYRLTYQRLSAGSSPDQVTGIEEVPLTPLIVPAAGMYLVPISPNSSTRGFLPMTVYRMQIEFFDTSNAALGPQSDWFYAVTAGTSTSPNDSLKWGRVDLVLLALHQFGDSKNGMVGLNGSLAPDGIRYTGSDLSPQHPHYNGPADDTGWCDWFYHYIGATVTDGLDGALAAHVVVDGGDAFWHTMNPNAVPNAFRDPRFDGCGTEKVDLDGNNHVGDKVMVGCQDYTSAEVALDTADNQFYSNISTNIYYDPIKSLPKNQGLGNYQAMDSHAGMFLAFDPAGDGSFSGSGTIGTVWSVEGNVSDHVAIMHRAADDPVINGYGKLDVSMFSLP